MSRALTVAVGHAVLPPFIIVVSVTSQTPSRKRPLPCRHPARYKRAERATRALVQIAMRVRRPHCNNAATCSPPPNVTAVRTFGFVANHAKVNATHAMLTGRHTLAYDPPSAGDVTLRQERQDAAARALRAEYTRRRRANRVVRVAARRARGRSFI